jgi:hypothetical protein
MVALSRETRNVSMAEAFGAAATGSVLLVITGSVLLALSGVEQAQNEIPANTSMRTDATLKLARWFLRNECNFFMATIS